MILRKESLLAGLGLVVAGAVIISFAGSKMSAAPEELAATGVSVIPLQVSKDSFGFAMVDPKNETVWVYEVNTRGPAHSRLKLVAARSWHYDKMLEEYNSAEPRPQQVKNIIEQLLKPGSKPAGVEANSLDISTLAEPNQKSE
jgi:hypothetical protein